MQARQQGSVLFAGVLILIGALEIVQLWLLTATLEAVLAHTYKGPHSRARRGLGILLRRRPATEPFRPIASEQLARMECTNRAVAARQIVGRTVFVAPPTDLIRM